ncbi:MAG: tetratricopeptide repeat protein [Colwellia sp.]|nr:tetratricopeptide repeat protein [Colwellia sp.]
MKELLFSELKDTDKSLIEAFSLVEEVVFGDCYFSPEQLSKVVEHCNQLISTIEDPLEQAEKLINELFIEQLFIDRQHDFWPVNAHKLSTGFDFKLMAPALKSVVLCHIFKLCNFEADIIFVPEKNMVRVVCDELYAIIFDPVTGESLDWHELDLRMDDLDGDPQNHQVEDVSRLSLIAKHVSSLKNALIREGQFPQALKCVDILISLRPDDPFERRDRGFLLHQLDCFKVAYDDYQYFVDKCPKDPAAQLLKMQLDKITIADTVLH